jgi:uncharacterized protein YecT (DUF1311 family)
MRWFWIVLFAAVATSVRVQAQATPDTCSSIDPFVVRKCVGERIEHKEHVMARQFAQARKAVGRNFALYGNNDNRTSPRFLEQSQTAWKRFVDSNCTVIAAYGGGSNSAISDRLMHCYESELDHRIQFLRDVAEGTGVVGI